MPLDDASNKRLLMDGGSLGNSLRLSSQTDVKSATSQEKEDKAVMITEKELVFGIPISPSWIPDMGFSTQGCQ